MAKAPLQPSSWLGAALEEEVSVLEASLRAKDLKITSLEGQLAELEGRAAGGGSHRLPGRGGLSQRAARALAKQSDLLEVGEVAALHAEFVALAAATVRPRRPCRWYRSDCCGSGGRAPAERPRAGRAGAGRRRCSPRHGVHYCGSWRRQQQRITAGTDLE